MKKDRKIEYIKEHLPYELEMLKYTQKKLNMGACRADWNVLYQSFAVNARNLYMFLTNEDSPNVRAKDFTKEFKAKKNNMTTSVHFRFLAQVFHLGPNRPVILKNKVSLNDINLYFNWICENVESFLKLLSDDYKAFWPDQEPIGSSGPSLFPELTHGPTGPPPPHQESKP